MMLASFQCRGFLPWITVGQGLTVLAVGAGGGCLDIFSLVYHVSYVFEDKLTRCWSV